MDYCKLLCISQLNNETTEASKEQLLYILCYNIVEPYVKQEQESSE